MSREGPSLRRQVRATFLLAIAAAVLVSALGVVAFRSLLSARADVIDEADPALVAAERLLASLVEQETGVRGFVISGESTALEPFERGRTAAEAEMEELRRLGREIPSVPPLLDDIVEAVDLWRAGYAYPVLAGEVPADPQTQDAELAEGRFLFDDIRATVSALQRDLASERESAKSALEAATYRLVVVLLGTAVVLVAIVGALWRLFRQRVEVPLQELGDHARLVAAGDLGHPVEAIGPAELQELGLAMEQMRLRILEELATVIEASEQLTQQSEDLARSNAELEQFAYVASHDLQEPLRKVASFCQLLQSRYQGQLDERADQYIEFAVDGAKRMQALINDLLAFSRVGRVSADEAALIPMQELVDQALENLATVIEETGAEVSVVGDLPTIRMERSLGVALFQNLIGNGVKFRRPEADPRVSLTVQRGSDEVEIAVSDNGIGIESEYADRVFVIFQRLHTKEAYAGTGIGLSMCRKIVEHHGGRIWVDPDVTVGTTVRLTLPLEGTP